MRQDFYVYALLDPRRPGRFTYGPWSFLCEPFYIGKGCGRRRLTQRRHGHCKSRGAAIQRDGLEHHAITLSAGLTESDAFELEIEAIRIIGRRLRLTGPLVNQQRGGSGVSRRNPRPPTPAHTREKIRRALTGRSLPEAVRAKLRGLPAWNKGQRMSQEQRAKLSAIKTGRPAHNKNVPMSPEKREKCAPTMFKKGTTPHNKGKPGKALTEQQKEERRAYRHTPESLAKIHAANSRRIGQKRPAPVGAKISAAKRAKPNLKARGIPRSKETIRKIADKQRGVPRPYARKPRPPHVVVAMQAGRARWLKERRAQQGRA